MRQKRSPKAKMNIEKPSTQNVHWMSRDISFFGIKKIAGGFNLEMLHRLSWRCHGVTPILLLVFSCLFSVSLYAESAAISGKIPFTLPAPDAVLDKTPGALKSLDGQVGGQSVYGMAVVFNESETEGSQELWINFNNKMRLKGFKKLSELEYEDRVRVIFKETKEGQRLVREIELLEKKQKEGILKSIERKFTKQETPQL